MTYRRRTLALAAGATGTLVAIAASLALAASVPNGGFEANSFKKWSVIDKDGQAPVRQGMGGPGGDWQIYKGKFGGGGGPVLPRGGMQATLPKPPKGKYAAGLGTSNPGNHILHRDVSAESQSVISLQLAYWNGASEFVDGDGLKAKDEPNQQLRVDLLKPNAPIYSLKNSDIVETLFDSKPSTPNKQKYKKIKATVGKGTYTLRIAEVDNQNEFQVGVDDLKIRRK